jgi:VWFA-related protein
MDPLTGRPVETPSAPRTDAPAEEPSEPIEVDREEATTVRLVILDVVVMDRQDRTVGDLTVDDFEVITHEGRVPIDTLDVNCAEARVEEPKAARHPSKRDPVEAADAGRRIALALDYLHLNPLQRTEVIERAMKMVEYGSASNDEYLVAALTGGLRVEQPFTVDHEKVLRMLHRMKYDISLWNGNFRHINETGFVEGLTMLLDVLGTVQGNKAVILFSSMGDVPLDTQFKEIAAVASASRCAIYPVDARGLQMTSRGTASIAPG